MLDHVERFQRVRVDRLIFSKLDESVTYGTVFATAALTGVPVSYVTTGQRVPEDIEVADAAKLCGLALNAVRNPQAA
jgi:flagellar biosynthesis protein FlhF